VLYNGDRLVFPRNEQTIRVLGQVVRPGYVPFQDGQTASYYIDAAGGVAPGGSNFFVMSEQTGELRTGANTLVKGGDTVFVNRSLVAETPEIQSLALNKEANRTNRISAILMGLSTVTSIVTAYVAIRR